MATIGNPEQRTTQRLSAAAIGMAATDSSFSGSNKVDLWGGLLPPVRVAYTCSSRSRSL
jgi:hypothetical protein